MTDDLPKSKSQLKRDMGELAALARGLVKETVLDLDLLPLEEDLRDAIRLGRRCKKGALKRQLKHITGMLSRCDDEAIRATFERLRQPHVMQVETEHRLDHWRIRLLNGDTEIVAELMRDYPAFDRQHLNQLVRNALKEKAAEKPPKYYRQIFQYLKTLSE